MENKSHALMAGLFTLALLAAAILAGMWLNRDRIEWVPYQIATRLSIPGLSPQAAVRYRGLEVGKVDDIGFDPQVPGQILVHLSLQPDTPVTQSTFATLGYQGVTGIAYVQLDDDGSKPVRVPSSKTHVARIEMRPSLFDELQTRGLAILKQTEQIADSVNHLLTPQNQAAILDTFDKVGKAATAIEAIPRRMEPALARLPQLALKTEQTLGSLDTLAKNASALTSNLNRMATTLQAPDGPMVQLGNAAEQVGIVANRIEFETLPLAGDLRSSLRTLNRTLEGINDRPQSVLFGSPQVAPGPGEVGFGSSR
jgi:phospholipid/cholesterol/gamma-HCH transport system substrate-binding protein